MSQRVGASASDRMRPRVKGRGSVNDEHQPEISTPDAPWDDPSVRDDVKRNFLVALPEPAYYKLRYISRYDEESMQEVMLPTILEMLDKRAAKVVRRNKAQKARARAKRSRG